MQQLCGLVDLAPAVAAWAAHFAHVAAFACALTWPAPDAWQWQTEENWPVHPQATSVRPLNTASGTIAQTIA
ncbi:MAG: hypothetical protein U0805_09620 [Pirellulales bacterium]